MSEGEFVGWVKEMIGGVGELCVLGKEIMENFVQ